MNSELNHDLNHSDPDVLALVAMGETVPDADARHVASCEACEREVAELGRVVHLARVGTPGGFAEAPSDDVWSRISAELGLAGDVVPESIRRADAAARVSADAAVAAGAASVPDAGAAADADANADATSAPTATATATAETPAAEPGPAATHDVEQASESGAEQVPGSVAEPVRPDAGSAVPPRSAPDVTSNSEHTAAPAGRPALHAVPRASDSTPLAPPERAHRHRGAATRGSWIPLVAAAAAVVIVGGIAVTASLQRGPSFEILAAAELGALPDWEGAAGEAVVEVSDDGERNVVVTVASDDTVDGYREVWLISEDLSALVSIGVLEGEDGRFVIPAGIDLEDYPIVDVSDEPLDGNPAHSGNSIVRGTLES